MRSPARRTPEQAARDGDDPFAAMLDTLAPGERLVLAVDQLEEIFTACRDEGERAAFAEALVASCRRRRSTRGRRAGDSGRFLWPLRGIPGAVHEDQRQPCASRADEPRGTAASNRASGPPGVAPGRSTARSGAPRRRRGRARRAAPALHRLARAVAGAQRPHPAPRDVRGERRRQRRRGPSRRAGLSALERAPTRARASDPGALGRC